MTLLIISITYVLLAGLSYTTRGGKINLGGTQIARSYWGIIAALGWLLFIPLNPYYSIWVLIASVISLIVVGHSAYQSVWKEAPRDKQHEWVGGWLPPYESDKPIRNTIIASIGNACVEASRALIVFGPALLFSPTLIIALPILGIGRAVAYLAGTYLPLPEQICGYKDNSGNYLVYGNDKIPWCEILNGISWGLTMAGLGLLLVG